jgi:DNA (cytosine-5)-methyltransferase 1
MKFLSVFSGIEAASVAWKDLAGWEAQGISEIDPFASAVLANHYPHTQNYGDITKHPTWEITPGSIDLLIGGSPCQSFSLSGKRLGLQDIRGQLSLTYISLVATVRPRFIVWENVVGCLTSNKGRDFGCFLYELGKLGYGICWRVLDSQNWGLAQRRRRVWLVASLGNTATPASILFQSEGESWNKQKDFKGAVSPTLQTTAHDYSRADSFVAIEDSNGLRRLTITEAERLQGFPDGWTQVPWKGKPKERCPDSLRFKAVGNSMSVPVVRWIGQRIASIEAGAVL